MRPFPPPPLFLALVGVGASIVAGGERPAEHARPADLAHIERRLGAMGTVLVLSVEADDRAAALEASECAVRALEEVEARLSTWREESELSRLNRAPVGERFPLSDELEADLKRVRELWLATGGTFDPAIGSLVEAWGLRSGGRVPPSEELRAARVPGGFAALDLGSRCARRRSQALRLEEGGFGKGAGLDAALAALLRTPARSATLDLGGQIAVFGIRCEIPIAHPRERGRAVLALAMERGSLSTSGNSEHGFVSGGVRYGHLLDPRTGAPAREFGSLTVWASDATTADALSTGLYVMGADAALAWGEAHEGIGVLAIETLESVSGAEVLRARATADLHPRLTVLVPELALERFERAGPHSD